MSGNLVLAIVMGAPIVGYLLGAYLGRALRMKNHGWKLGLIFASVLMGSCIAYFFWPPKLGIDLSGGVILVYEVDQQKTAPTPSDAVAGGQQKGPSEKVDMAALVQALQRRINPTGVREVVIREYGANQVEIIIPKVTESEIDDIKRTIVQSGYLKFEIVANPQDHAHIIELADLAKNSDDPVVRADRYVREGDRVVAEWVPIGLEENTPSGQPPKYKVDLDDRVCRVVDGRREALMIVEPDPRLRVDGSHLRSVASGFDNTANPCVRFWMSSHGAKLFGALTGGNLPDKQSGLYRLLGIVMDDQLLSAPRIMSMITDEGQITGRFTQKEVDFLVNVLRAGRLPAVLKDQPISENAISPLLGEDTIRKGSFAIGVSLIAVLIFMVIYYRFSGVVACMALITNLILILALMILISGAFTLPGLAGLVLTVGMSVDANVLIFERIREELNRGAALRMAIRNGFGRATTTIVDANLTTLITALVLYAIGTDQIRGFAVTLILGIVISMYTAIFCSRVAFDIAERKGWTTRLSMLQILSATRIDFLGMRKLAVTGSVGLIIIGLAAVGLRGEKIFDIDFLGGTSVQAVLKKPVPIAQIRVMASNLADDVSVTEVDTQQYGKNRVYKIDTSLQEVVELENAVAEAFRDENGESLLVMHAMDFTGPEDVAAKATAASPDASKAGQDQSSRFVRPSGPVVSDGPPEAVASAVEPEPRLLAWAEAGPVDEPPDQAETTQPQPAEKTAESSTAPSGEPASEGTPTDSSTAALPFRSQAEIQFKEQFSAEALTSKINAAAESLDIRLSRVEVKPKGQSDKETQTWLVRFSTDREQTTAILKKLQSDIQAMPFLLSSSTIGSAVAGKTQNLAIAALLASLLGIVAYIWVRFQRVMFGLAAVVALVHDVAFTVGAVALSFWLSKVFGFLLIDEFKISLPVVAALLTIIGYSLNDTIVVFDRIREVRGKSPDLSNEMVNASINQTLSRTLLTSITTLLVVVILYAFGGQGIHGFAFALLVGVVVGTYSSIFIASPALMWMSRRWAPAATQRKRVASS